MVSLSQTYYLPTAMNSEMDKRVKKRVQAKKGFLIHLGIYLAAGLFFLAMNIATFQEGNEWWFFYPMIPWGLGVMIHYVAAFGFPGTKQLIEKWEIEETAREMKKMRESERKALPTPDEEEQHLELKEIRKEKLYNDDELV